MKKWVLYYLIISLLFGAIIYLITLFQVTQEQTNKTFNQITQELVETQEVDTFLRYSTLGYEPIKRFENDDYVIEIVQALGSENGRDIHQLVVFVIPLDLTRIQYATDINDPRDQSQLILTSDTININTTLDEPYKDYALSVGLDTLGFYYYTIMIEEDVSGRILLKDYDGEDIIDTTITINYEFNLIAFVQGMREEEIEARISVDDVLNEILITRLLIFAAVDIVVAIIISVILRRKAL
ncbi:MAG: hypothetical protein ACPGJL_00415 [Acholeplasmataceae bacterium]